MVARSRGWIKTHDKPNEETYELSLYGVEIQKTLVNPKDQEEAEKQLKHENEQLSLANVYPGRERQQPGSREGANLRSNA
jgi:hypothetical protein